MPMPFLPAVTAAGNQFEFLNYTENLLVRSMTVKDRGMKYVEIYENIHRTDSTYT